MVCFQHSNVIIKENIIGDGKLEKWEQYYTEEQIKKLQEIELENLQEFISVCKKLNLEYFIYGGTLLGYEKYGHLIPWDDDIDVAMPRDSYNKFVNEADKVISAGYYIQTPYNCKKSPYPYTKLRKKGTKYVEYINRNLDIDTGIYIDIYPVDKIPDDEERRKKQYKEARKWILIYDIRQSRLYDKKEPGIKGMVRKVAKWGLTIVIKLLPQAYCIKKMDYYMTMYNNTPDKRYAVFSSPNYNNIFENMYPLEYGNLHGIEVCLPGDRKTHLAMRYGDYSKDLSPEERIGHVPYILNLGDGKGETIHEPDT